MWYSNIENFKNANGYSIDGIWYPRVTAIVGIKAKPALYIYYGGLPSYQAGEAIKARSAEEGTLVHNTLEAILRKEPVTVPDLIKPSVDAFLDFYSKNEVIPLKVEERVVSKKHWYAGTIDVLAEVNGVVGVLDIKTSQAIYRDYGMQTAAYVEAFKEDPTLPDLTSWVLRIDQYQTCLRCSARMRNKGGNVKIRPLKPGGNTNNCEHEWSPVRGECEFKELGGFEHNIKAFLAAKSLWEWEHQNWVEQLR